MKAFVMLLALAGYGFAYFGWGLVRGQYQPWLYVMTKMGPSS